MRTDVPRAFARELDRTPLPPAPPDQPIVGEADLNGLPDTARRYLRFMDVVGRRRDWSFRVAATGRFRTSADGPWMPCEAWQYNTRTEIARIFRIRVRMGGVVPVVGHDTYVHGHGRMHVKLLDLFTLGDDQGEPLDVGELVTWLNDAVLIAPTMLLDERVRFEAVDERSFDVSVTDGGRTVAARVFVDERGAPTDFETTDRFVRGPDGAWQRARWHTPMDGWARTAEGRPHPTTGRAEWLLDDGPLPYAELEFRPETLRFDVLPGE